jgi:uncharacterized protein YndB with AHSA1/START domain
MMKRFPLPALLLASLWPAGASGQTAPQEETAGAADIVSERIALDDGELILKQTIYVDAGLEEAWAYFTDKEHIQRWMAPVAEADIKPGGAILTNYDACASVGDEGTIELNVLNFIPHELLTLQSSLESAKDASWMHDAIMAREDDLYNIIEFEAVTPERTRITSWGLGYRQDEDWQAMLGFFIAGNEWSYQQLQKAVAGEEIWPACEG